MKTLWQWYFYIYNLPLIVSEFFDDASRLVPAFPPLAQAPPTNQSNFLPLSRPSFTISLHHIFVPLPPLPSTPAPTILLPLVQIKPSLWEIKYSSLTSGVCLYIQLTLPIYNRSDWERIKHIQSDMSRVCFIYISCVFGIRGTDTVDEYFIKWIGWVGT